MINAIGVWCPLPRFCSVLPLFVCVCEKMNPLVFLWFSVNFFHLLTTLTGVNLVLRIENLLEPLLVAALVPICVNIAFTIGTHFGH